MRVARRPLHPSEPWGVRTAAETILAKLEQADVGVPLQGFKELVSDLYFSDLDLTPSNIAAAAVIAIAQIREPAMVVDAVITDVAAAFKKKPEDIRDKLTAFLQESSAEAPPIVGPGKTDKANHARRDLEQLAEHVARRTGDAEWGEPFVQDFMARYRELLGATILRAEAIKDLFYAGDAFRGLFEREFPIVLIAACTTTDEQAVDTLMTGFYGVIVERGLQGRVSHIGRFSAKGAQGAAYRAAERVENLERIGVCSPVETVLGTPMAAVHKGAIFGRSLGDETWFFREMARRGVAIVFGGDDQALDEARDILTNTASRAICCGGFGFECRTDLIELASTTDATWIPNASADPAAGRRIGTMVSEIIEKSQSSFWTDPLLSIAWRKHPGSLSAGLFENAGRQRVVRLVAQASHRLERAGIPSARVWCEASHLAQELARHVLDISNPQSDPSDNARWQQRAREAFSATGSRVLMDLWVEQDIEYASRVGIKQVSIKTHAPEPSQLDAEFVRASQLIETGGLHEARVLIDHLVSDCRSRFGEKDATTLRAIELFGDLMAAEGIPEGATSMYRHVFNLLPVGNDRDRSRLEVKLAALSK